MGSICLFTPPPNEEVAVLMAPFPLNGHLNQLLHLSRHLSASLTVHFAATADLNRRTRSRIPGWDPHSGIIFHDFPPLTPPPQPETSHFPSHLPSLISASSSLRRHFSGLIRRLCTDYRRVVIINDSLMGFAVQDFVLYKNAEAYTFHSVSAFAMFFFLWESLGRPFDVDREVLSNLPLLDGCFTAEFMRLIGEQYKFMELSSGRIYNTCRVVEDEFMKLLEKPEITGNKNQWALGPFNSIRTSNKNSSRHQCLNWLDEQSENSVILVSFGTTSSFCPDQIRELALGLETSGHKFVWVLREADGGDRLREVKSAKLKRLPENYEERIRGRGIIVTDWAPQLDILSHSSTGGFMSHCGWNSCIESISAGVPIAAWPIHSDQPRNAVLITGILKIGVIVRDWDRREETVKSAEIATAVRRLMAEEEGNEMRRRAAKLGGDVTAAMEEGGITRREMDNFISHVTR